MRKQDERRILTEEMSWIQKITGVPRFQKIRNDDIREVLGVLTTLLDRVAKLQWFD